MAASKENRLVAASAMGWVGVSSFVLFLLCWVLGLADVWRMLALLFAICMITPSNLIWQRHYQLARRECLDALRRRPPSDLEEQYAAVMRKGPIPRQDVERIWLGLANFHKMPADVLRSSDIPSVDLKGVIGHPDYDMFFCPLVVCHKGPARKALDEVADWGDLILCLYQFEQEQGKLGTREVMRDGKVQHVWDA